MASDHYQTLIFILKKNALTIILLGIAVGLALNLKVPFRELPALVDWDTIVTLSGLLLVTMGLKESGLFNSLAYRISRHIHDQRILALFLVFLAALLSMFLTNDITLFIIVPLTLSLQKIAENDYGKIIIFEAIAVNAGSALTPIGNPQNIFLWHQWGVSFPVFVREMAPLVLVMSAVLLVMTLLCFTSRTIKVTIQDLPVVDGKLFAVSAILLIAFIISTELHYDRYFLVVIFLAILFIRKNILTKTDWGIIILFIVVFVDLGLILQLQTITQMLALLDFNNARILFLSGAFLSQVISNVPSAIVLANYSDNFRIIAYGVSIGANGLLIGSFANLIALRFTEKPLNYLLFHVYSLPYFIVTLGVSYYFLLQ